MMCKHGQDDLLKFKPSIRRERKGDLSDSERSVIVGAGQSTSETDWMVFFHTTTSEVYRDVVCASLNTHYCGATAADDHTGFHSCQKEQNEAAVYTGSPKLNEKRLENLVWSDDPFLLRHLDVFGVNNLKAWSHPALDIFFAYFIHLSTN